VTWLRHGVILLLFAMMIVVGKLSQTGLFEYVTFIIIRKSGGSRWTLLCYILTLTLTLWFLRTLDLGKRTPYPLPLSPSSSSFININLITYLLSF
jgi:hypothetical protein